MPRMTYEGKPIKAKLIVIDEIGWFARQIDFDPEGLIFIEETSANTKMARLYGRSPRSERCRAAVPCAFQRL